MRSQAKENPVRDWIRNNSGLAVVGAAAAVALLAPREEATAVLGLAILVGAAALAVQVGFMAWRALSRRPRTDRAPLDPIPRETYDRFVERCLEFGQDDTEFLADALDLVGGLEFGRPAALGRAWRALTDSNRYWSLQEDLEVFLEEIPGAQDVAVALAVIDLIHPRDFELITRTWQVAYRDWENWAASKAQVVAVTPAEHDRLHGRAPADAGR